MKTTRWERILLNILVTLDQAYLKQLSIMLSSLLAANPGEAVDVYMMNAKLTDADFERLEKCLDSPRCRLIDVKTDHALLAGAPVTSRYPQEMYYRIFATKYLPPTLDRILYLDPDLVVLKPLAALYETELTGCFFAAATHVRKALQKLNCLRLGAGLDETGPYVNSGVMLMNLPLLRAEQDADAVFDYIERRKYTLLLPDQDIISGLYAGRILPIDARIYNMTERLLIFGNHGGALTPEWVEKHSAIVHYCGRNKPWKSRYNGKLGVFYERCAAAANPF